MAYETYEVYHQADTITEYIELLKRAPTSELVDVISFYVFYLLSFITAMGIKPHRQLGYVMLAYTVIESWIKVDNLLRDFALNEWSYDDTVILVGELGLVLSTLGVAYEAFKEPEKKEYEWTLNFCIDFG